MLKIESQFTIDEVTQFLQGISDNVQFKRSFKTRSRDDKGKRKIAIGTIVNCNFLADKINTFGRWRSKGADDRAVIKEIYKEQEATVEVLYNGQWEYARFDHLQDGDVFRVYYDNKLYKRKGQSEFRALSDPYLNNDIWQISVAVKGEL